MLTMPIEIVGKHAFGRVYKKYTLTKERRVKLSWGYVWLCLDDVSWVSWRLCLSSLCLLGIPSWGVGSGSAAKT